MTNKKIPIPTRKVHFDKNGKLTFKVLSGCNFSPEKDEFTCTDGNWVNGYLTAENGDPVSIHIDGDELVIKKYTDYTVDEKSGFLSGGKHVEIARFNICSPTRRGTR